MSKAVAKATAYLLQIRNYSPVSVESYESSFERYRAWMYSAGIPDDLRQFTGDNVFRFAEALAAKGQKASTIVIRLSALSTIAQTLMKLRDDHGKPYLLQNPTKTFEWPTVDAAETKFLLPEELAAFLAVRRPMRESLARDLFVDTGVRVSELCRVNVSDVITVNGRTVIAMTTKGRGRRVRKRHVPISPPAAAALHEYLVALGVSNPQDPKHRDQPLLTSRDTKRWTRTGLSTLMARIGKEAGISRLRVSAHKLRHTANVIARLARRADGTQLDRWTRSRLLSHQNPASIDRYEHLLPDELFEARDVQRGGLERYVGTLRSDSTPPDTERTNGAPSSGGV